MNFKNIIADYEGRAEKLGIKMYLVCEEAKIAPSTYYRWRQRGDAKVSNLTKIDAVLSDMEKTA